MPRGKKKRKPAKKRAKKTPKKRAKKAPKKPKIKKPIEETEETLFKEANQTRKELNQILSGKFKKADQTKKELNQIQSGKSTKIDIPQENDLIIQDELPIFDKPAITISKPTLEEKLKRTVEKTERILENEELEEEAFLTVGKIYVLTRLDFLLYIGITIGLYSLTLFVLSISTDINYTLDYIVVSFMASLVITGIILLYKFKNRVKIEEENEDS